MKWLSQEYIQQQSQKSSTAALACARKHWFQWATATQSDVLARFGQFDDRHECALCLRYEAGDCVGCPLFESGQGCLGENGEHQPSSPFGKVWLARHEFFTKPGIATFEKRQWAAWKMYLTLLRLHP